jgi:hypothetical protein
MKEKLFTSTNDKKGIFLQAEKDTLKISLWKKETPVHTILSKERAFQLIEFITNEMQDDDLKENHIFWDNYVENFLNERVNKEPEDREDVDISANTYIHNESNLPDPNVDPKE